MSDIDTSNDFFVGSGGDQVVVMIPIVGRIPKDKAMRLAAWIVALVDHSEDNRDFKAVLRAVENT